MGIVFKSFLALTIFLVSQNIFSKDGVKRKQGGHSIPAADMSQKVWQTRINELPQDGRWNILLESIPVNGKYIPFKFLQYEQMCFEKTYMSDGKTEQYTVRHNRRIGRSSSTRLISCCFEVDGEKRQKILNSGDFEKLNDVEPVVRLKNFTLVPSSENIDGKSSTVFKVSSSDPDLFSSFYCAPLKDADGNLSSPKLSDIYQLLSRPGGRVGEFVMKPDSL